MRRRTTDRGESAVKTMRRRTTTGRGRRKK
jgi:hypothetical protein